MFEDNHGEEIEMEMMQNLKNNSAVSKGSSKSDNSS